MLNTNKNRVNASSDGESQKSSSAFLKTDGGKTKSAAIDIPSVNLPKGGGAIKGIDEKFSVNAVNGTSSFSIELPFSSARGFSPSIGLSYNSGGGNGIFGLGWNMGLPSIKRKTDKGLPLYFDAVDSDTYLYSDAEDLVPEFAREQDGSFSVDKNGDYIIHEKSSADGLFFIRFYIPRTEGIFARIERWTSKTTSEIKWRVINKDNITTLFGWSAASVITDPNDPSRIFEWKPEFVFDDKGNCSQYIYRPEDKTGFDISLLHNRNRLKVGNITYTNLYLQKVLYGNKTPYTSFGHLFPAAADYIFSTVFDYGTLKNTDPPDKINDWDFRTDAFSDYKAGFEIRTTRLCKRVLLFHHFLQGEYEGLVKTLGFAYDTDTQRDFTFLNAITLTGYIKKQDGSYSKKSLPPFEFTYQEHDWNPQVKAIASGDLVHAPAALDEQQYQFTDLFNEGLAGILTEQANGWYYKHNLGNGHFEEAKLVSPKPSFTGLGSQLQLADLDADGGKQLVRFGTAPKGYFELNDDNEWQAFRNFEQLPNISFSDVFARMLDVNGDGKPELLIAEENDFTWYPSEGRDGFGPARKTSKPFDEEAGPYIVFADEKQTIFLASMSGNGLTDIVRIRNGEVCYWPNLGYGKFGTKVAMDNAPLFDHPDSFNPNYIKLADIDGSGTTDIIYLGKNKFSCWMNLSGNSFTNQPFEITAFPAISNQSKITVTDLLGNGVSCIVWSSPLPGDAGAPLQYIDLMNSKKPHIMVSYKNNLGKEVSLTYTASTQFYIEDKLAGNPWITKLHFPVYCVSSVETIDAVSGHHAVSSYKYHHGYYDHPEREFRGFGMVEQSDAENFEDWKKNNAGSIVNNELHQDPVVTKTWFHTGAYLRNEKILHGYAREYWYEELIRRGFPAPHQEETLPDARIVAAPGIPNSYIDILSALEWQQAVRACKSMSLRTEVFARDAGRNGNTTAAIQKELTPFSVATHNCFIELLQPRGRNKYAVYIVKESEATTYSYERIPGDPRIAHTLNISLDRYGNVLESASVVYARKIPDATLPAVTADEQNKIRIVYSKNRFSVDATGDDTNRLRLPAESLTYELKNVAKTGSYYTPDDFTAILTDARSDTASYHELNKPLTAKAQKRLIEHSRTTYYNNNLKDELPLLQLHSLALPFQSYQQAYTPELLTDIFSAKVPNPADFNALLGTEGKFTHCIDENNIADDNWWIPSGSRQYLQGIETPVAAQQRFYSPVSYTDPFQAITKVTYYSTYFLFINSTTDALGNTSRVDTFNFRTLSARRMKDINGNLSESIADELGIVKAMAVMGKDTNNDGIGEEADDLTGLQEFTDPAEIALINTFFNAPDSQQLTNTGKLLLQHATARYVYDLSVYKNTGRPPVVASITREEHFKLNNNSPVQMSFEYTGGNGKVAMKKIQAAPGFAKKTTVNPDDSYTVVTSDTTPFLRWIGTGKTILNNKGNPVRQYEPYFSATQQFENLKELVETGVSPLLYYDAMGRLIKTENPDGTFSKVEFNSWKQILSDANDTTLDPGCSWYINRHNRLIDAELVDAGKDPVKEKEAADKAALHAGTPNILHFDSLGRPVLSVDHNKNLLTLADEFCRTKIQLDIEDNLRAVTDGREIPENANLGNTIMQYKYDMLGNLVYQNSMDAGRRWLLKNILGSPLRNWDERNHQLQYFYDIMHRPVYSKISGGDGISLLDNIADRIIYGESLLAAGRLNEATLQAINILGKPIQHFDTGGVLNTPAYDFKGEPLSVTRKLFKNYKATANWIDANLAADLEADSFTFSTDRDAMGRITRQTAPDGSIITPLYNETGLLTSERVVQTNPAATTTYIKKIEYNEKGGRSKIIYGNDVITNFYYDTETFRLNRLESKRKNNDPLQDWNYTFDPVGNITHIEDRNIPVVFFNNQKITGVSGYTYDALYHLCNATGRENNAALNFGSCDNWNDAPRIQQINPGDPMAVFNYSQTYQYDPVGNIKEMRHFGGGGNWTRTYEYETGNNRLKATHIGDNGAPADYLTYAHNPTHGFLQQLPHLENINWNFKEEIISTTRQHCTADNIPVTTYYQYDSQGQRIRKITENFSSNGAMPSIKEERIYIEGFERYKKYTGTFSGLERISISLQEQGNRFVMIETRNEVDDNTEQRLARYQLHNYTGSAAMELDDTAQVISYEEFHPFGTTAWQANNSSVKSAAKRYRYTGMERDEETGLLYCGARYYLSWLGRWASCDLTGMVDGTNIYAYAKDNPIRYNDPGGTQANDSQNHTEVTVTYDPPPDPGSSTPPVRIGIPPLRSEFGTPSTIFGNQTQSLGPAGSLGGALAYYRGVTDPAGQVPGTRRFFPFLDLEVNFIGGGTFGGGPPSAPLPAGSFTAQVSARVTPFPWVPNLTLGGFANVGPAGQTGTPTSTQGSQGFTAQYGGILTRNLSLGVFGQAAASESTSGPTTYNGTITPILQWSPNDRLQLVVNPTISGGSGGNFINQNGYGRFVTFGGLVGAQAWSHLILEFGATHTWAGRLPATPTGSSEETRIIGGVGYTGNISAEQGGPNTYSLVLNVLQGLPTGASGTSTDTPATTFLLTLTVAWRIPFFSRPPETTDP